MFMTNGRDEFECVVHVVGCRVGVVKQTVNIEFVSYTRAVNNVARRDNDTHLQPTATIFVAWRNYF